MSLVVPETPESSPLPVGRRRSSRASVRRDTLASEALSRRKSPTEATAAAAAGPRKKKAAKSDQTLARIPAETIVTKVQETPNFLSSSLEASSTKDATVTNSGGSSGGSRRKRVKPSKVIRVVEETPDIEDDDEDDLERKRHLDR